MKNKKENIGAQTSKHTGIIPTSLLLEKNNSSLVSIDKAS
jgi:hypothetical protein